MQEEWDFFAKNSVFTVLFDDYMEHSCLHEGEHSEILVCFCVSQFVHNLRFTICAAKVQFRARRQLKKKNKRKEPKEK